LSESKNIVPWGAFKLNISPAMAETWPLTLILLTWRIWWASNNASKWQMGYNLAFKGLKGCMIKVKLLVLGMLV